VPKKQAASLPKLIASSRIYRVRRLMRLIPRAPRLQDVQRALRGAGPRLQARRPRTFTQEPEHVRHVFERAQVGGSELDIGVLFADVRGFTSLAEHASPEEVADRLAPFYRATRTVLVRTTPSSTSS
jgi:adenylate cyclase